MFGVNRKMGGAKYSAILEEKYFDVQVNHLHRATMGFF